jgi:hypothetical protein
LDGGGRMSGKGSKPRPLSVPYDKYANNYNNIFRKVHKVKVKDMDNGDQYIELPDEVLESLGWKEGDEIEWKEDDIGSYIAVRKKEHS